MNILIVDDVADNAELMRRFLKRRGHTVFLAENGHEAVNMTVEHKPDLVFMDLSMPVMDGLEATQIIRRTPAIENTPVIALTAHAMASDEEKCLAAGCNAFASKPVDFKQILDLVERFDMSNNTNKRVAS